MIEMQAVFLKDGALAPFFGVHFWRSDTPEHRESVKVELENWKKQVGSLTHYFRKDGTPIGLKQHYYKPGDSVLACWLIGPKIAKENQWGEISL